jgi:hypothetical protein
MWTCKNRNEEVANKQNCSEVEHEVEKEWFIANYMLLVCICGNSV